MEETKKILDNKINFIIKYSTYENYFNLERDFISFIFKNKKIERPLINLILSNKTNPLWLKEVFSFYTIDEVIKSRSYIKNKKIKYKDLYQKGLGIKNSMSELTKNINKKGTEEYYLSLILDTIRKKETEENKVNLLKFYNDIKVEIHLCKIKISTTNKDNLFFNYFSSKLVCNGLEVKLVKGKDIFYILKYIFQRENIHEECFYDEIREFSELDKAKTRTDKNIYDNLLRFKARLNKKSMSDIFNISSHSVSINRKYNIKNLRQVATT